MIKVILTLILLVGCSEEKKIVGYWVGESVSQVEGIVEENELLEFNYLGVFKDEMILKYFYYTTQDDQLVMVFGENEKRVGYELMEGNHIVINEKLYDIELNRSRMIIRNENNTEMNFVKGDAR
ncbi:hypothetical protein [Bacillus horti]|uniref:Uncharacterized protein n=1 Tax=Caldalkalibacillus horti TaxID=77523 RepID=A0ABT9VXQ7_9BACI|nr:hypothetical protein [Bacillus horti]